MLPELGYCHRFVSAAVRRLTHGEVDAVAENLFLDREALLEPGRRLRPAPCAWVMHAGEWVC